MCSDAGAVISVDGISKFFEIYPSRRIVSGR